MSESTPKGRIPELDGLRGIAILLVWVGHYFARPATGAVSFLDGYWSRLGWTGVDLFFVLSGFLIGGILLKVRESPRYFSTFYVRRFFRIIPLYYAWILLYIAASVVGRKFLTAHVGSVQKVDLPILAHFLFLQNFGELTTSTLSFWWFTTTWSLAVEEQFYLVAPLCVKYLSKRALTIFLIFVTLAAPFARWLVRDNFRSGSLLAYQLMPCRADSLAIGMLAAIVWTTPRIRAWLVDFSYVLYLPFAILLAGAGYLWRYYSDPAMSLTQTIGYSWLALLFALAILLALTRPFEPVAVIARLGFLREIGGVSYCIYIVHLTVFLFCQHLVFHAIPAVTNVRMACVSVLAALLSYSIAKFSWKFFEGPLLKRGQAFKY